MEVSTNYNPLPWQVKFHQGDWKFVTLCGGKGSGKSKCAIEELIACALETPKTTYLIGRKTLPSLMDTTWKDLLSALPDELVADYNKAARNITLLNGSMFIGRPLDEPKKFDSLQISGFFLDEADELDEDVWRTLKDRVREVVVDENGKKKYPRYRGILGMNPTDEDHWIPQFFLDPSKPKDHEIFFSSAYDNAENLPPGYIEGLKQNYSEDMQQRIIYGFFGKVHKGRPVFPQFSRGNYVWSINYEPKATLFRSWDFGFNRPAVVWFQFINGQMRVLAEKMGQRIYLDDFIKESLKFQGELFPGHRVFEDFCDPHGADERDSGKTSVQIMNDYGLYPKYRRQTIAEGIKSIKWLLDTKNQLGEPNFYVHGRCKTLVEGLRGGYHRMDGEEIPEKDGYYDHLIDAMRYGATHLVTRFRFNQATKMDVNRGVFIHPKTGRRIEY